MADSLSTDFFAGIPDGSVRISVLVVLGLVIAVMIVLAYFRMKEVDDEAGVS